MSKKIIKIIAHITILLFSFVLLIFFMSNRFYNSIFRLSYEQIKVSTNEEAVECKKISDCNLIPGDILIRRYITPVSSFFEENFDPYFTHSAMYLGNDQLFEALGNYEIPENQISITKLSNSDWYYEDMHNFVVIRPKNYDDKIKEIISTLTEIAKDPEYIFGPYKEGRKTVSCSDIILKLLIDKKIITELSTVPKITTPDYLFWSVIKNKNFEIVGYSISKN